MDSMDSRLGPPVDARAAFETTREALLDLLVGLGPEGWAAPTAAAPWAVRDIVAHLLGDDVARLSRSRDGHSTQVESDLPDSLHRANAQWVVALRPASPAVLVELLRTTSTALAAFWHSVDLEALGEAVSWAGPGAAPVWLDCARDFTEDWVHQAQIREAAGQPPLDRPDIRVLLIDTMLRAIPYALDRQAAVGHQLRIDVVDLKRSWSWQRGRQGWVWRDGAPTADAVVGIDSETLWRTAVRMIEPADAVRDASISGERSLAWAALQLLSIIR